jgi:hypothetical protein
MFLKKEKHFLNLKVQLSIWPFRISFFELLFLSQSIAKFIKDEFILLIYNLNKDVASSKMNSNCSLISRLFILRDMLIENFRPRFLRKRYVYIYFIQKYN